jgi:anti-sigma factor RsiW
MFGKESSEKNCSAIESVLIEYLDGRAESADRHAVEEHLKACASCRVRAEEFRSVWGALDDLPEIIPSPSFDAALRARIASEPARHSFWSLMPTPRLAFAFTALVILSVWFSSGPRVPMHTPVAEQVQTGVEAPADSDFGMIRDLPVLENYDVVSKFDALSELSGPATATAKEGAAETR